MKYFIIASVLFFISCREERKREVTRIISGEDTMIITGIFYITDVSKIRCSHGSKDTTTGIFTFWFDKCETSKLIDTISFDTIYLGDQPLFRDTTGTKLDSVWIPLGTDSSLEIDVSNAVYYISYLENFNQHIQWYNDTIPVLGHPLPIRVQTNPFDSAKYLWKKQIYWEGRMNRELGRLNKNGHANDISKALVRYQDSAIKYSILLKRLQK